MSSANRFVYNPSTISISRSKWNMNNKWQGPMYHGDLVPIEITEVLPGDSFKCKLSSFVRTATNPIAPIMDDISISFASFFVPKRLVWDKTKQFYGEATDGYGIATEVLEPRAPLSSSGTVRASEVASYPRSLSVYLGLVRQGNVGVDFPLNLNVIRSYLEVYNSWFRNENFSAPYVYSHTQVGDLSSSTAIATLNGLSIRATSDVPVVCKRLDRFTSCLPWTQKLASPVLLPLGTSAPVSGIPVFGFSDDIVDGSALTIKVGTQPTGVIQAENHQLPGTKENNISLTGLTADLSNATAATINQLRMAFATQRYYETLARTGSKYREYIKGMFGVNIGDTTAQMPEFLGGFSYSLNIDQVLSTAGYSAGATNTVGAPGAISCSGSSKYLYNKSFTEPGYIVSVAYTKHNRTYGQGIDEIYTKHELFDYYNPKFACIGEQAIKRSSLYFSGKKSDDETPFGFQEAWSDYRYKKDQVIGLLAPSNSSSYNFWNLAENFASAPFLSESFIKEDRNNIARCLAGGTASPDYFLDLLFEREVVRPMPLYSIPGLIDHF